MADSAAARKQAEAAARHLEGLASNDPSVRFYYLQIIKKNQSYSKFYFKKLDPREIPLSKDDAPRFIDPKQHDAEIEKYKRGLLDFK